MCAAACTVFFLGVRAENGKRDRGERDKVYKTQTRTIWVMIILGSASRTEQRNALHEFTVQWVGVGADHSTEG